ncbi:hypothetical protein SRHO_G00304270 [Serrasalmus rhombeus]
MRNEARFLSVRKCNTALCWLKGLSPRLLSVLLDLSHLPVPPTEPPMAQKAPLQTAGPGGEADDLINTYRGRRCRPQSEVPSVIRS